MDEKEFHRRGLIAGPGESEEEFRKRADYCLSLQTTLGQEFPELGPLSQEIDPEALAIGEKLYGISPTWVPLFYSNHDLPPWHGGCAWIFQKEEAGPKGALLQLRKGWFKSPSAFWGLYTKKEIVAHELCHASRMMFEEPKYEEILAYETSSSPLRKWVGPLVRSRGEALFFFLTILVILLVDLMALGSSSLYTEFLWLKLIPLGLLAFGFARVAAARRSLAKACRILGKNGLAIAFCLTDREIDRIAKGELEVLKIESEEFRWRQIKSLSRF